jgi:ribosome-associated protein
MISRPARPDQTPVPLNGQAAMGADTSDELGDLIAASLEDDKAEDIVRIDLTGKSSIADEMIIASGRSARHVGALSDHIERRLKETSGPRARVDGKQTCDWVVIDAGDVIVHLFRPEVREFYQLERIWGDTPEAGKHRQQS